MRQAALPADFPDHPSVTVKTARPQELIIADVLFLDEVTEMSLAAQAEFLRVLQEREFQRLGATRIQKADIRVIAATNRDLRGGTRRFP